MDQIPLGIVVPIVAAIVGFTALGWVRPRLSGTTLIAPWCWSCLSFGCLCLVELALASQPPADWHSHLRYLAATTTFWPLIAVLGAKRPQDRAWQLIVLALGVIVSLPALEGLLYSPDTPFELSGAWWLFVAALILLGLANDLPTRRWLPALILTAGRVALLAPYLNGNLDRQLPANGQSLLGLSLVAVGLAVEAAVPPRRRPPHPIDRVWLEFRDAFGLLWGLRVAERFNAASRQLRWGIRLRWTGLDVDRDSAIVEPSSETLAAARQNLEQLFRRFVSAEWFADRWNESLP